MKLPRPVALVATTLAALALVAGCAGTTPLPASGAVAHYDTLAIDLTAAMAPVAPAYKAPRGRTAAVKDGACTYTAGHFDPAAPPAGDVFAAPDWPRARDAVNAVLQRNGFPALGEPGRAGSGRDIRVRDAHGAEVHLDSKGYVGVYGGRVDTTDCTNAALGVS